jgi:lipopolysaccharide transport system permease protein/teichoic acid transport system permease protein
MVTLLSGLGWITSSTSLFVRDIGNAVGIFTQFGLWLTPIFWDIQHVPVQYQWIVKLNPASYLVAGYRDSLTGEHYFWQRPEESLLFWTVTLLLLCIGTTVYRRLKPHFAEVI